MGKTATPPPVLETEVEIAASPAEVWAVVSDLPRLAEWSPQVVRTVVVPKPTKVGSWMLNLNHQGWKHWPTTARVVAYEPQLTVAFRVTENRTVWSFELSPTAAGTRLVQRREAPQGIAGISTVLVNGVLGGTEQFTADLRTGMQRTLEGIKTEVERTAAAR